MAHHGYVADVSLTLVNRTGAYHVCRDLVEGLPQFFIAKRYWRWNLKREPRGLIRSLFARAMILELENLERFRAWLRPRNCNAPSCGTIFFDPLYVLQARIRAEDIVLCHDLGPFTHSNLYPANIISLYREAYEAIKVVGPGMVFVSEATRDEFVRVFGSRFRFLRVIPLYVRSALTVGDERAPPVVRGPFLLTVGALDTRKNHGRVIEAFARSGLRERGYSYIICGPRGNSAREVETLARGTPGVIDLKYVSDAEIRWLYRHATGFVLPSLLEGFGLPALEAGQHGLVSLVGRHPAQTEAVGGAAIQVEPTSVKEIADGLLRLVDMTEAERAERVANARAHAAALTREKFLQRWATLLASEIGAMTRPPEVSKA